MKFFQKHRMLSGFCALAGCVSLLLRVALLRYAVDEKELIDHAHIGNIIPLVLSVAVLAAALIAAWQQPKATRCTAAVSRAACGGCLVGAVGIAVTAVQLMLEGGSTLSWICCIFGILAAVTLAFSAFCRLKAKKVFFLLSAAVVMFLMLLPVQLYQSWSAESQFNRYFFQLTASVCLLLWFYHRAAMDADAGSWRMFTFMRCSGVFFCLAAVPGSTYPVFYLTAGVWILLDSDPVRPRLHKDTNGHAAS